MFFIVLRHYLISNDIFAFSSFSGICNLFSYIKRKEEPGVEDK